MITIETIEEAKEFTKSGQMRMLYLSRPDCGVCTAIKPKVIELINKYPKIKAAYIDLDKIPEAAGEYSIFTIPGIIFYVNGKETIREARYVSMADLDSRINRYYQMLIETDEE